VTGGSLFCFSSQKDFRIDADTAERLGLMATATLGEGGWVDLSEPNIVRAGKAFVAVPEEGK
jgi:hypothetical protein